MDPASGWSLPIIPACGVIVHTWQYPSQFAYPGALSSSLGVVGWPGGSSDSGSTVPPNVR